MRQVAATFKYDYGCTCRSCTYYGYYFLWRLLAFLRRQPQRLAEHLCLCVLVHWCSSAVAHWRSVALAHWRIGAFVALVIGIGALVH